MADLRDAVFFVSTSEKTEAGVQTSPSGRRLKETEKFFNSNFGTLTVYTHCSYTGPYFAPDSWQQGTRRWDANYRNLNITLVLVLFPSYRVVEKKVSPLTVIVDISVTMHPIVMGEVSLERADNFGSVECYHGLQSFKTFRQQLGHSTIDRPKFFPI